MTNWYQFDALDVAEQLSSNPTNGLAENEARRRLEQYGPNELIERGAKNPWQILWEQLTSTLVVVLIVAAVISGLLGDVEDTIAILAIVVLNAALGFRQEYQAEQAMAALKKLAVPVVHVRREGHVREISARNLVPGDVVLLEAGNLVPADGRLLESANLRVQEAALTGESEPVEKEAELILKGEPALGDRRNMVYMGTVVTYGRGEAIITATGMETELGRVADLIQTVENEPTPLQRRLDQLGRNLALIALIIVTVIFLFGLWRGEPLRLMLLTAVSLAVAAVPEGLPAVVTIALALGAQRMLKRNALIRKLPAVETLGSVTVICSDKTGTLTENRMTVTVLDVAGEQIDLSEQVRRERNSVVEVISEAPHEAKPALALLLAGGALCNDVELEQHEADPNAFHVVGDPTEGALAVAAARAGLFKSELERVFPRVAEAPFDSERKRMTTVHHRPRNGEQIPAVLAPLYDLDVVTSAPEYVAITKGALDSLLQVSTRVWENNEVLPLEESHRQRIWAAHDELAQMGMRILGLGIRGLEKPPGKGDFAELEQDLVFIGMVAMIDPPRAEVRDAVATCQAAGIRPVMITGDHPLTARHIAQQLGIATEDFFLTGNELDKLSLETLQERVKEFSVFARVSPEHKLNIVQALQTEGHIVAMTGDGVNDAPALKKADIGVAMGITGTDVAKEAAEMVLQDDNFATIVAAVEEGRVIYDNIRKFIKFLLSCNAGEILVMLIGPFLGMPLPLLPLQILWMNLVTDGFPALALGVEPAERNVMRRPPYPPQENIFSRGVGRDILWIGALMGVMPLAVGYFYWLNNPDGVWQTMVFTTLVLSQLLLALAMRSERDSIFQIGFGSNRAMLLAVGGAFLLQLAVIYVPFLQNFFNTQALSLGDLGIAVVLSTFLFWSVETEKVLIRRRRG
ncbi:MAG: ATPase [Chloroflexi bacterium]|nr:MAG: ATPase [Chloroflexota bacterium]